MASGGPKAVEFSAGKLNFDPKTKKVTPDPRQGKVRVYVNQEGEKHFEWRDAQTGNVENDVYVFEFDAKFEKVAKSTGRVYYLHFESYEDKYFFWMQEKDASKDDEICKRVSDLINSTGDEMEAEPVQNQPAQPVATNQSRPNLTQNLPQGQNQGSADFSRLFSDALKTIQQHGLRKPTPSLNDILTPQFLESILQDKDYQDALMQHLPEKQQTPEGLKSSIKSAQLQQAIDALDEALNSEEGMTVLISLGFDASVFTHAKDGTEALILALEKWAKDHADKK